MNHQPHPNDEIVEYLLGLLPPDRREAIEQRILTDGDFHQEVVMGEEDLLDRYAHGNLTGLELRLFHRNFLTNNVRRRRLWFALALKKRMAWAAPEIQQIQPTPRRFYGRFYPYALAASLLVAGLLSALNVNLAVQLNNEQGRSAKIEKDLQNAQGQLSANLQSWSPQNPLAVADLSTGVSRGEDLAKIIVPRGIRAVQFMLKVPADLQGPVSIGLLDDANHLITTSQGISPQTIGDKRVIVVAFPMEYLKNGNYFLRISGKQLTRPPLWASFKVQIP